MTDSPCVSSVSAGVTVSDWAYAAPETTHALTDASSAFISNLGNTDLGTGLSMTSF
jgi:hypothetical protein